MRFAIVLIKEHDDDDDDDDDDIKRSSSSSRSPNRPLRRPMTPEDFSSP